MISIAIAAPLPSRRRPHHDAEHVPRHIAPRNAVRSHRRRAFDVRISVITDASCRDPQPSRACRWRADRAIDAIQELVEKAGAKHVVAQAPRLRAGSCVINREAVGVGLRRFDGARGSVLDEPPPKSSSFATPSAVTTTSRDARARIARLRSNCRKP